MPKITLTHSEPYLGTDHGNDNKRLELQPGEGADVSDVKAAQLLEDFPDRFKKGAPRRSRTPAKDDKPESYADLERAELRGLAAERGVETNDTDDDEAIRDALIADDESKG